MLLTTVICCDALLCKIGAKIKVLTPTLSSNIQFEAKQSLTVNLKDTDQGRIKSVNRILL